MEAMAKEFDELAVAGTSAHLTEILEGVQHRRRQVAVQVTG